MRAADDGRLDGAAGARPGGDALPEPTVDRRSLNREAWQEACRERWYRSEEAGTDLGEGAVRLWVRQHWPGFLRARWINHLLGERFWLELPREEFGLLRRVPADARPLRDEVLDRMRRREQDLGILVWARKEKTPEQHRAIAELLGFLHAGASRRHTYLSGD